MKRIAIKAKKERKRDGFTMIELLAAAAVFLVVITMVVQIFMMVMNGSWRLFGRQNTLDSARFVLESSSKELRMSGIEALNGFPFDQLPDGTSSGTTLQINNSKFESVTYVFAGTNITRDGRVLNSDDVEIVNGRFYVTKSGTTQPRVTMVMGVKSKSGRAVRQTQVNLQTTVSSRQYAGQ